MTFDQAELQFRELQARLERGEPMSRADFERRVAELAIVDERGVIWELHPKTGRWMYYDGADWRSAAPPNRDQSTVMPRVESDGAQSGPPAAAAPSVSENSLTAPPLESVSIPARIVRPNPPLARDREWIPLAMGSAVLLICAVLIFFGGRTVLSALATSSLTPTRIQAVAPTSAVTQTAVPTIARLPTPLQTATPAPVQATVIENRVNVRAAPSTQAKIIGKIQKDNVITLIGRSEDGAWYQVTIPGLAPPSWVFGETLQVTSGDVNTLPLVKP